jgi:hypothetical protein
MKPVRLELILAAVIALVALAALGYLGSFFL